jgi:predicted ribosomally synthesized peptide with SipW-like signal peptide
MKKILIISMACVLCLGLIGGAFAYFTDTETSVNNNFSAGAIDLQMSNGNGYQDIFTAAIAAQDGVAPGVEFGPFDVYFKNNGTMDGKVRVNVSVAGEADVYGYGEYAGINGVTDVQFAQKLVVTRAYLDGGTTNVAPYWAQQAIDNGYGLAWGAVVADSSSPTGYLPTVYGLSKITLMFSNTYGGTEWVWGPLAEHSEVFYLELAADAGNEYMFDGVNVTFTATLTQYANP